MAMNKKDKNLFKACVAMVLMIATVGFLANSALKLAGDPLRVVGAVACAYYGLRLLVGFTVRRLPPKDLSKLGKWVIVTGCTGGLGKCFAESLAKRGFKLLLVSRSASKLEALAAELKAAHGTECRWLAFDFLASVTDSKAETEFFTVTLPKTLDELKDDIALLVNNVGVGNEAPFLAPDVEVEEEASMVRVNCGAAVRMCRVLLPRMAARRAGAVLNISSGSCAQPTPYLAVYSATKAFLVQYSRSIAREYEDKGLLVTCVTPYYISGTGLYANTKASLNAPHAKVIVNGALATVASASSGERELGFSYRVHALMGYIFGTVLEDPIFAPPLGAVARAVGLNGSMLDIMRSSRSRYEAKLAREAAADKAK